MTRTFPSVTSSNSKGILEAEEEEDSVVDAAAVETIKLVLGTTQPHRDLSDLTSWRTNSAMAATQLPHTRGDSSNSTQ